MKHVLKSMATHEQDFAMRNRLDMLHETVWDFVERAFALNLVMWRTSHVQFKGNPPSKQDDVLDRKCTVSAGNSLLHNACASRVNRGIRCRFDIIMSNVSPFLEYEPVKESIRKIVDLGY
jgi:hypothetical protein